MTFEEAVEARATSAFRPICNVNGRVGWTARIAGLPAVTLQIVVDSRPQHMKGVQRVRPTTVQADVYARTPAEARSIRDALIAGLLPSALVGGVRFQRAMVTGVRSLPELQPVQTPQSARSETSRESIDITFTHNA